MRRHHRNALFAVLFASVLAWTALDHGPSERPFVLLYPQHDWPRPHPSIFAPAALRKGGTERACGRVEDALWEMGWPPASIPSMVAIAWAESGCRTEATHVGTNERSVGPLQINIARAAHPWVTEACARDYGCSARAARDIWRVKGFRAWAAYTNGRWRQFFRRGN